MKIQVIKGLNARKRLRDGTDGGFAPLATGTYSARTIQNGYLAITKGNDLVVYLSPTKLEEHINNKDLILLKKCPQTSAGKE